MDNRNNLEMKQLTTVVNIDDYKRKKSHPVRVRSDNMDRFMKDRVAKLRELYEEHTPEVQRKWVMPKGETDGRKAIVIEVILGEDVSPFDLPDFEDIMPKPTDYNERNS